MVEPGERSRVLVIDDDASTGKLVRRVLGAEYDVVATVNAHEALAWIGAGDRFDVILCDLLMPELNGQDFYAELQKVSPDHVGRTIIMTGGAVTVGAVGFLQKLKNRHVMKPFDVRGLRTIVSRVLRG